MTTLLDWDGLARRLPLRRRAALAVETLLVYSRVRWLLRRHDLPETLRVLRAPLAAGGRAPADPKLELVNSARIGWAVVRTLSVLPSDSRCLMRSLVLTALLARRGIGSTLVIGVRPEPEFAAHAWLEYDGRPVLPAGTRDRDGRLVAL